MPVEAEDYFLRAGDGHPSADRHGHEVAPDVVAEVRDRQDGQGAALAPAVADDVGEIGPDEPDGLPLLLLREQALSRRA
ncbi:MAG: hypothetical protein M0C28_45385 [Candidatus Moduliflexus flocculans]|nr:hypothetical protein [Candidatus Moduliflexus flocculans]